jgi:hypothetical protein
MEVDYNAALKNAAPIIKKVNKFLGGELDTEAMFVVVDPTLYRQRKA